MIKKTNIQAELNKKTKKMRNAYKRYLKANLEYQNNLRDSYADYDKIETSHNKYIACEKSLDRAIVDLKRFVKKNLMLKEL